MAQTKWSAWFDDVLSDVPGCSQAMATKAIRAAAIEFCERSEAWRVDLDPVDVLADEASYDFDPDSGTVVVRAMQLWYDGKDLTRKSREELALQFANWTTQEGTPLYYTQENPSDGFILVPKPVEALADAVTGKLAIKPSQTASGLESFIFEKWRDAITDGALFRLFAMQKKPWSNPALAGSRKTLFDQKIAEAKLAANKGFTRSPLRVKAQFF
jgi:hypothetical protein